MLRQVGDGRRQQLDLAGGLAGQGLAGADPDGGDGLPVVVAGDLALRERR